MVRLWIKKSIRGKTHTHKKKKKNRVGERVANNFISFGQDKKPPLYIYRPLTSFSGIIVELLASIISKLHTNSQIVFTLKLSSFVNSP
jgi:hypothetical protein